MREAPAPAPAPTVFSTYSMMSAPAYRPMYTVPTVYSAPMYSMPQMAYSYAPAPVAYQAPVAAPMFQSVPVRPVTYAPPVRHAAPPVAYAPPAPPPYSAPGGCGSAASGRSFSSPLASMVAQQAYQAIEARIRLAELDTQQKMLRSQLSMMANPLSSPLFSIPDLGGLGEKDKKPGEAPGLSGTDTEAIRAELEKLRVRVDALSRVVLEHNKALETVRSMLEK